MYLFTGGYFLLLVTDVLNYFGLVLLRICLATPLFSRLPELQPLQFVMTVHNPLACNNENYMVLKAL